MVENTPDGLRNGIENIRNDVRAGFRGDQLAHLGNSAGCEHIVRRPWQGEVVYMDTAQDLAFIRVPGLNLDPLPIGRNANPAETVTLTGYPHGGKLVDLAHRVRLTGLYVNGLGIAHTLHGRRERPGRPGIEAAQEAVRQRYVTA